MSRKAEGPELRLPGPSQETIGGGYRHDVALMIAPGPDDRPDWRLADLPTHLAARIEIDRVTGEWIWQGLPDRDGYGRYVGEGAHRVVWKAAVGPIPDGLVLDHVKARGCTRNLCVSPWHLEPVTHRTNVLRGRSFAAVNFAKDKCVHGHEFDLFNTYVWNGRRDCRACIRRRVAEYKIRQRAAPVDLPRAA